MIIDSNILVYSIDKNSEKHERAQEFLKENVDSLEISHQNIFETLRVITHPKLPIPMHVDDAIEAVEHILKACRIVSPNWRTARIALELIKKYKLSSDLVFDAYLVATAISNDITTIATDNVKDLQKFPQVTLLNPFSL